jgi:hypothetical protein
MPTSDRFERISHGYYHEHGEHEAGDDMKLVFQKHIQGGFHVRLSRATGWEPGAPPPYENGFSLRQEDAKALAQWVFDVIQWHDQVRAGKAFEDLNVEE